MTQSFYRSANGEYLGSFDGAAPPDGAVECPMPTHGNQVWNGSAWADTPAIKTDAILAELNNSDVGMISVIDDIVNLLIAKGVISMDDFPASAQEKLDSRKIIMGKL